MEGSRLDQVAGAYDITGGNYVSYIQAQQEHRANLDIFAEGSVMEPGTQGIYTLPDSPVATLADLKGQTVAINAPDNILFLLTASVLAEHGVSPSSVHFASIPFPEMPDELKSAAVSAAVMPEPYASGAEEAQGGVPLADLDQGATTSFPVEGYVVTKKWAAEHPRTLAAFYRALEQGQRIADVSRAAAEQAMVDMPARSACPGEPRRSWPWTPTRSAPGRSAAWTRFGCSAWSTSCGGSSGSESSTSARC